jgi:hypothetical protein
LFLLVDHESRRVLLSRRIDPGKTFAFEAGDEIPLAPLSKAKIAVNAIFAGIVD